MSFSMDKLGPQLSRGGLGHLGLRTRRGLFAFVVIAGGVVNARVDSSTLRSPSAERLGKPHPEKKMRFRERYANASGYGRAGV